MKKVDCYKNFLSFVKMGETTYCQRNRKKILNRAKYFYGYNKEALREKAKNKYRELSEEDKNIKREYGRSRHKNISEEEKQRLKQYQKNYREANKN